MRRLLWLSLALVAIGWLEFEIFPGHTYLHSATQIYLPMLERMESPGYLSRDLVATNPDLSYTIYDEVTLFLRHHARLDFQQALEGQQILFRMAGLLGVFLLARATGAGRSFSLLIAALVNLGATLSGPAVCTVDTEPVPMAFACGATLLAAGLIAAAKPLLGGLAGAVALLYDPVIAAPFWVLVVLAWLFDRNSRKILKPILPVLLVSILLLANMAQLQPQMAAGQIFFARLSTRVAELQRFRTPYVWFSPWSHQMWLYLSLAVFGVWAAARVWPRLNRQMRWLVPGMGLAGVASAFCTYLLVDHARLAIAAALQPSRLLAFTVLFTSLLCGLAATQAVARRHPWEAAAWFALVAALPLHAPKSAESQSSVVQLAQWAEQNTWGGSLFLFPDAGRELYPGVFRAQSRRALYVDWKSGMLAATSQPVALEWFDRWQRSMEGPFSQRRLLGLLPLPIDYYVVKIEHCLPGIPAAFENREFCVYDAQDLRYPRR